MNRCYALPLLLLCVTLAIAADDPPGYRPLFDGDSLAGWEGAGQPAEKCWKVEDGAIVCTGEKGTWLRSKEQFDDFNMRLEYKLKAGGNSGVYIRVPENGTHHGDGAGIEVQVLDDGAERYRTLKGYQYTGSLYAIDPATTWNETTNVAWQTEIPGKGWSSPSLHHNRLYLTTAVPIQDSDAKGPQSLRAVCVDATTGRIVWNVEVLQQDAQAPAIHSKN